MEQNPVTFGTLNKFIENFQKVFTPIDSVGSAIAKLQTLSQTGPVEEYISEFHTAAVRSKITDNAALIEFFVSNSMASFVECQVMCVVYYSKCLIYFASLRIFDTFSHTF